VADSIRPTPDDSESSVGADESGSRLPAPGAAATDDQSKAQREAVGVKAAKPRTTSELPVRTKPSLAPPRVEPTARSASQRPMLTMLADVPLTDSIMDGLGYLAYADALCGLIDNPQTPTPLTIAVSAAWGAGKTSLVNMVTGQLADRTRRRRGRQHIVCVFPAWLHDDAPHLGAALAAKVAREVNGYRSWPRRLVSPLPSAMLTPEQRWRRRIMIGSVSLIVAVLALLPASVRMSIKSTASVEAAIRAVAGQTWAPVALLLLAALAIWPKVFASAQAAARFVDDPKSEAATGSMWQVREQLGRLIREAIRNPGRFGRWLKRTWPKITEQVPRYRQERRRVVLIVDDLERCRPPRAIDVCEVASQLLGHQDVVTIIIGDMATLAASAEIRYAALETVPTTQGDAAERLFAIQPKGAYGRLYLEKMVQIQFDLPPPSPTDLRSMLADSAGAKDVWMVRPTGKRSPRSALLSPLPSALSSAKRILLSALHSALSSPLVSSIVSALMRLANMVGERGILATLIVLALVAVVGGILIDPIVAIVASAAIVAILLAVALAVIGFAWGLGEAIITLAEAVAALVGDFGAQSRKDQKERFITDESPERKQGEEAILKFLAHDDVPRRAKRMINHLRLLLLVAHKRDMIGGSPPLEAVHLGKWVVLLERWPELGRALRADPGVMALIEEAASKDPRALEDVLHTIVPEVASTADLAVFLQDETKLAGLVERLVYYRPARQTSEVGGPA
jgi:KAP family P-loop domain